MIELLALSTLVMTHIKVVIDIVTLIGVIYVVYRVMDRQNKTNSDFIKTLTNASETLRTLEHTFIKTGPCFKVCAAAKDNSLVNHYNEIILKSNGDTIDGYKVISDLSSLVKEVHTLILGMEADKTFPIHKHEDSNQIFVSRLGKCKITVYDNDDLSDPVFYIVECCTDSVFVPKGLWHSMEPIDGPCEVFVISIPPLS